MACWTAIAVWRRSIDSFSPATVRRSGPLHSGCPVVVIAPFLDRKPDLSQIRPDASHYHFQALVGQIFRSPNHSTMASPMRERE
jgi:hypothetical protein